MRNWCIILAGGLGTRLRSAVPDFPKCLAPISNRPFLQWQVQSLSKRGVTHFLLALGHCADQVLEVLTQPWARDFSIATVIEHEPLGTGGAARFAMDEAGLEEALVANGDTFLGGSLRGMLAPLNTSNTELMRIATVQVPDRVRFGGMVTDDANRVTVFLEKGHVGPGLINAGLYRIHRSALDAEAQANFSLETQVMPRLLAQGLLHGQELAGPFIDIGVPDDYYLFNAHVHEYVHQA